MVSKTRQMQTTNSDRRNHPYVERRPGVCGDEPVIVGTHFPVRSVVTKIYRLGMTPEEMVEAWPYLTLAQVHDALSFYHDHRSMVDRAIRKNQETAVRLTAGDIDAARQRPTSRVRRRR